MQLITWPIGRLGSRFGLLMEPHRRRAMHSALGRFLDQPLDLAVGLIDPDGQQRVLPFTQHGELFYGCEQFERINSITYRGYDPKLGLKFELNLHSPFYPQDEPLCLMPVLFVEMRITWAKRIRWLWSGDSPIKQARLFIRLNRPDTHFDVSEGRIDLSYDVPLAPAYARSGYDATAEARAAEGLGNGETAHVDERILSINPKARPLSDEHGHGLQIDLPVTEEGSGIKWRLVWAAHCGDEVIEANRQRGRFRYNRHWPDLDAVMKHAVDQRDEHLAHSRRFEKLLEQAPLTQSRRHLLAFGFHSYLTNTWWCDLADGREWFSNWEGTCMYHSTVDVEYNVAMLYLAVWPDLLAKTIRQWADYAKPHDPSGGRIMSHDMGRGLPANGQAYPHDMPVEENANVLLLLQTLIHWTGKTEIVDELAPFVVDLTRYLLWTDRDDSGFPSEGTANTIDDAAPAVQYARKQTYLAVKRVAGLQAAADLLSRCDQEELATTCRDTVRRAIPKIDQHAWLGDHYAICVERDATGMVDVWTGKPLPAGELKGWDDYSIYTFNGLLLPEMIGKPLDFNYDRVQRDITSAIRETLTPYGCGHSSSDATNIWISQNIWRDLAGRYLGAIVPTLDGRYWDLQTFSNTGDQSFGFIDTYIGNELAFYPRGAVAFGHFLAGPRIRIDRLYRDGKKISITPDRYRNSRWPLLPLADWQAGKIPVCVVDGEGQVTIEGEIEEVEIHNPHEPHEDTAAHEHG
jgi:hypothetical protein